MSNAQEDFDLFSGLAERLGLDENEAESFVGSAMKRLGHRPRLLWEDGDDNNEGGSGGDFFSRISGGSQRRESRPTRPNRDRRGSGWDSQYGRRSA